jgi:hypothetical protein
MKGLFNGAELPRGQVDETAQTDPLREERDGADRLEPREAATVRSPVVMLAIRMLVLRRGRRRRGVL